jgi:hypothetical protein
VHTVASVCDAYAPGVQSGQYISPSIELYFPLTHVSHPTLALPDWYLPLAQDVQLMLASLGWN